MNYFERDLEILLKRLRRGLDHRTEKMLNRIKDRLIQLSERNVVKINHSVMELVCAKYLILNGYDVDVERPLEGHLVCDLYAKRGMGTMIVEIETGFVPPENALNPFAYWRARVASKIARYSVHSNKFGLATPPHHILHVPSVFIRPPRKRSLENLRNIKSICDTFYVNPSISLDELRYGRVHAFFVLDVDEGRVKEFDPNAYSKSYRLI
jgi:hypothetical protein